MRGSSVHDGGDGAWSRRIAAIALIATSGVAVIYVPQPIQTLVAAEFEVSISDSAAANVAVQAGYAFGIVILVSLSDRFSPRSQVTIQLMATALALALAALAPSYWIFVLTCFIAGAAATMGQILIPAALRLAPSSARAQTVAVLVGSFLVGLFAVRTALGAVAEVVGWRGAVLIMAVVLLGLAPVSRRVVPDDRPHSPPAALQILASLPKIAVSSPSLRLVTLMHSLCFASFISVWSAATLHAVQELELTVASAAFLGTAGLLGGAVTVALAPLQVRLGGRRSLAIALCGLLIGTSLLALAPTSLGAVLAGLLLVSFGLSTSQVTTQARALASVAPEESGRANTVFIASAFLLGATATAVADVAFRSGGFASVSALSLAYAAIAVGLAIMAVWRNTL